MLSLKDSKRDTYPQPYGDTSDTEHFVPSKNLSKSHKMSTINEGRIHSCDSYKCIRGANSSCRTLIVAEPVDTHCSEENLQFISVHNTTFLYLEPHRLIVFLTNFIILLPLTLRSLPLRYCGSQLSHSY